MKRDGVKRLRQRSKPNWLQRASRGRRYAFGALSDTTTIADNEPQAPGEELFARCAVVKWRRYRSSTRNNGAKAEGSFIAFCALSDAAAVAMARGLRFILQAP